MRSAARRTTGTSRAYRSPTHRRLPHFRRAERSAQSWDDTQGLPPRLIYVPIVQSFSTGTNANMTVLYFRLVLHHQRHRQRPGPQNQRPIRLPQPPRLRQNHRLATRQSRTSHERLAHQLTVARRHQLRIIPASAARRPPEGQRLASRLRSHVWSLPGSRAAASRSRRTDRLDGVGAWLVPGDRG